MSALLFGRSGSQLHSNPTMLNEKEFNETWEEVSTGQKLKGI